ncbi:MAG: hypothetical protein HQM10_14585 [Candidatus Riflebacteria bacterium]|nr:hypothetical protein [Candidatus Riflebacteria bacterium]
MEVYYYNSFSEKIIVFLAFSAVTGFSLYDTYYKPTGNTSAKAFQLSDFIRSFIKSFIRKLFPVVIFLPPFLFALSEGRIGSRILKRSNSLYMINFFNKWSGGVNLDGVSLKMKKTKHLWRSDIFELIGAKKFEKLRIDGYTLSDGTSLADHIVKKFDIQLVDETAMN